MTRNDDDELTRYMKHFEKTTLPAMRESAFCISILGEPDAKICLEVGAAVLLDKPIIVAVPKGRPVPANIRRVASRIIELDLKQDGKFDDATSEKIESAIRDLTANDARIRRKH